MNKKPQDKTQRIAISFDTKKRLKIAAETMSTKENKLTIGGLVNIIVNKWLDENFKKN